MGEPKREGLAATGDHGLKKTDMKVSTVVFMIFCLVAAGCYGIEEMIPSTGPGLTIIILCVMPIIWGLPFGLVASELGSVRPQTGGYYKWVQEALGEFWGFMAGWWRTVSIYIDNTIYVILAGGYLATVMDLNWGAEFAFKAAMIAIFTIINIRGVKEVGTASTILSILVMVSFAVVALCGFLHWGQGTDISFQLTPEPAEGLSDWFFYIAGGISIGMWMYSGYESMSTIAGEIENPQVIPKGTLITIPLIMAVYLLPTIAGLGSMGDWENWSAEAGGVGYGDVVSMFWGPAFGIIFVAVAILAQCSIYNTYITSGSRGFFALADDYMSPPILVKCDKKRGVPYVSVLSVGIVNLILCMLPFGLIIILDVSLLVSSYILVYISAVVLRKRIPREEYQFRIPGGDNFLKVLCVIPICVAIFAFFINGSDYYLGGMIGLLSGPVLYFIWRRKYGGLTKKNAKAFPANKKTGLAVGDTKKVSFLFLVITIMNLIANLFMPWYEDWKGEDGWLAEDYFDGMFPDANVATIVDTIQILLWVLTAVVAILTVVFYVISKKVEPPKLGLR